MKRVFFITALIGLLAVSCTKENSENNLNPLPTSDYMQLKIGNYWVYEWYRLDSLGNEIPTSEADSSIITGDTNISGKLYYKMLSTKSSHISYLRDSIGYLVDMDGRVLFSDHDFTNIIRTDSIGPGLALVEYMMYDNDSTITAPIGNYPTIELRGKVIPLDPQYPHGINYTHYFYAEGLGMIKSSNYYFSAPHMRVGQRLTNFGNTED